MTTSCRGRASARDAIDVDVILFDLDNTLYEPESGLLEAGNRLITRFIAQRLAIGLEEADRIRVRTWREYGATARGLEVEHGVPQSEFFAGSIEQLQVEKYLRRRPELVKMLRRLPQRLCVFTNAPGGYARRVLQTLGIADEMDKVMDISVADGRPKPDFECYDCVVEAVGASPERIALVEDTEANLEPAAEIGMFTIKLGPPPPDTMHLYLESLTDLPRLLRQR